MSLTQTSLQTEEIQEKLRRVGLTPTPQRVAICRSVFCGGRHSTADQIKEELDRAGDGTKVSLATVYNTLKSLVEVGLLKELKLSHSKEVIYDDVMEPHYHFLDCESGTLHDVRPEDISVTARLECLFNVEDFEILFKGTLAPTPQKALEPSLPEAAVSSSRPS